ncbi:YniB family protein [Edaphovirga cremea]|uniref:YniB family protein n=1 Tax=Edaphovirga cremea TaxID=2267246 RepID=UPI003988B188
MTYQQAGRVAVLKRVAGWVIFIPALLSTLVSLLNFIYQHSKQTEGINAVMLDFMHVMIDMIRFNTGFLDVFWFNSPVPQMGSGFSSANVMFVVIYILIFVGLALQASGARMSRQVRHIREGLEDQLILEHAKGTEGRSRTQLEEKLTLPHHTIFLQFFPLYILPLIIAIVAYFIIKLVGF